VKIWDLRKLKNFKTLEINEGSDPLHALTFDQSGAYLAIANGSNDVQIVHVKSWTTVAQLAGHSQAITGVCFGEDARFVVSVGMDKSLRLYSTPQ